MRETLEFLVELQDLEDALRELRIAKSSHDKLAIENAETKVFFEQLLGGLEGQIEETRAFCKEKRGEIEESESNARRSRQRMASITSQRELNALNKELDIARRQNQTRNEELKKLTDQLEATQADYDEKKQNYEALCVQMSEVEGELKLRIETMESEASTQRTRQVELRAIVDKPMLSRFDRILNGRDGVAVADVVNEICGACRMAVPPQSFIRLQTFKSIEQCQNCRRILVFKQGLAPAPNEAPVENEVVAAIE